MPEMASSSSSRPWDLGTASCRPCLLLMAMPPTNHLPTCSGNCPLQMAKGDKRQEVCTREYTINLGKRLHAITFKKRAPRAIKEIQKFAAKVMGTEVVRVDVKLNKAVWSQVRCAGWALACAGVWAGRAGWNARRR